MLFVIVYQVSSTSLPEIHELQARRKTAIEEQFDRAGTFELTSVEQETYERYFYGTEHWNYFSNDEDLGPVVLSLKQEIINGRDQFRSVPLDSTANRTVFFFLMFFFPS